MTDALSAANSFAIPAPIPFDAPVTTATFPFNFPFFICVPFVIFVSALPDSLFPLARRWLQSEGLKRRGCEYPRYAQVVFFLITRQSGLGFVSLNSVDSAAIITKLREL